MTTAVETPTDAETTMPLLIAPNFELMQGRQSIGLTEHHLYHPNSHPLLQDVGGRALRSSRVQLLPAVQHNYGRESYHARLAGPPLPESEPEQFKLCVLAAAGYLPREVLDIGEDEPAVRPMTAYEEEFFRSEPTPQPVSSPEIERYRLKQLEKWQQHVARECAQPCEAHGDFLLTRRAVRRHLEQKRREQSGFALNGVSYSYGPLKKFFVSYLQRPEMLDVKPRFVKRLLSTHDEAVRREMGEKLLLRVSVVASAALQRAYREAQENDRLNKRMPKHVFELVRDKLGTPAQRQSLVPEFAHRAEEVILEAA